jgi:predicted NUDIX family NTP pyrophosphohydrolase
MVKRSAGLLIYRQVGSKHDGELEVLLGHPGGPFWQHKDESAWTIPKGLLEGDEDPLSGARREAAEELGLEILGNFRWLGEYKQPGGKQVLVWAVSPEVHIDPTVVVSNGFEMEWPPRSGRKQTFPEIDRAGWFSLTDARHKILKGQAPMLDDLQKIVRAQDPPTGP